VGLGGDGRGGADLMAEIDGSTSLGLTIVRTLVNELGGTLTASSDNGTTFELAIPLAVARGPQPS
jgi:signal transduction histidine kinase